MANRTGQVLRVAATYIGTVVGAGFASGQSILQFFTVYGTAGLWGIVAVSLLFVWLGTKMMLYAHRIGAYSYQELNDALFGKRLGRVANGVTGFILFGVTVVMFAGIGSLFEEQLGLPAFVGVLFSIGLGFLVMTRDLAGIMQVNALVVPLMLLFSLLVAIKLAGTGTWWPLAGDGGSGAAWSEGSHWFRYISPLAYAALNFATAQAVLVPLGGAAEDEEILRWGGVVGGIGLGLMLVITHLALYREMPGIMGTHIPMGDIIRAFGPYAHILFIAVLYGEIFTTLVGNVFGLTRQLRTVWPMPNHVAVLLILIACVLVSPFGFTALMGHLYPLFGYLGLAMLVLLACKSLPKW